MNKRIEKLFNEAGFHKPEAERLGIEDKFEKFAELIVMECLLKIENERFELPNFIIDSVKQHFGVE